MKTVYLSLGSNLGDREATLRSAVEALNAAQIEVLRVSSIYETEPMDVRDQGWFLNLVVECRTELFPVQLLARINKIEAQFGRKRVIAKGPRTLDIDIILYGRAVVKTPVLQIPHARYRERRFVLAPLAELVPEIRDPETNQRVEELLKGTAGQKVAKLPQSLSKDVTVEVKKEGKDG